MKKMAAYGRVSTPDQHLERQINAIEEYTKGSIPQEMWFLDHASGKNLDRTEYQRMRSACERGEIDEIIVKELDRLGRNKEDVKDELRWFKDNGIIVRILAIPTTLVEIPGGKNTWAVDMITNVIIEVYASIAEQERQSLLERQAGGIAAARERGVYTTHRKGGKPRKGVDSVLFEKLYQQYQTGLTTQKQAAVELGLTSPVLSRRFADRAVVGERYNPNLALGQQAP